MAARGSHSDHATSSGDAAAEGGISARGGRGARGRGRRGCRGWGRQSTTPAPPSSPKLVPAWTYVERNPLEFLVRLQCRIQTRLQLPIAFAKVMSKEKPMMLRLRVHGCGNGSVSVTMDQSGPRLLFLDRGWKSFAHANNLWDGHVLCFKMMADNLLSF
ncbi:l-ascorbate oxidase-like protein [Hordeum vulgare]|nr:l-ascorbate oxidase-like protein [Hordeum vulgare]